MLSVNMSVRPSRMIHFMFAPYYSTRFASDSHAFWLSWFCEYAMQILSYVLTCIFAL